MERNNWHTFDTKKVLNQIGSNQNGLKDKDVKKRLERFGYNRIEEDNKITPLKIFSRQFKNILVAVLFVTTLVSLIAGEIVDAALILVFIAVLVVIGFVQEFKAEKSLEALKKLTALKTIVIRNGKESEIDSREIVPGDVILLRTGDKIPADARMLEVTNIELDESILTGESIAAKKIIEPLKNDISVAEGSNMCFMGTVVTNGRGKAVVVATGMNTEMGRIAKMVQTEEKETPLKTKLTQLSRQIAIVITFVTTIVFLIGVYKGEEVTRMFLASVALAVSAIPESLPVIVTVTLAIGVHQMVKQNSIIRKLPTVETLGSADVICCDKTGTLTKNEMTVREIYTNRRIEITGVGYKPEGDFFYNGKEIDPAKNSHLLFLLKAGELCNNASLRNDMFGNWWVVGSPTEGALLTVAKKAGLENLKSRLPLITEISFNSKSKAMITVHKERNQKIAYAKGAPEEILKLCKISDKEKRRILHINDEMASKGLRVLALAHKKISGKIKAYNFDTVAKNLEFIGLVGMSDPIRPEVKDAIKMAKGAGVDVIVITGDQKLTTLHVAKELGISTDKVLTGNELERLNDDELENLVEEVKIYARTSPEHKLRIVKALQKHKHIVAMTGDGVNDAPALKTANIGVAMGIKGTEVAKEASDMVLVDDNFKSIVSAIKEGRKIFDNIRKSALYLLSTAVGEVMILLSAVFLGMPIPFVAVQILWINIVTEGIPAIGFAFEKEEPDIMKRSPRNPKERLLSKEILYKIIGLGALMFIGSFFLYLQYFQDMTKARTMAFNTLVMFELFNMFNCRTQRHSFKKMGFFSNKILFVVVAIAFALQVVAVQSEFLASLFKIVPLSVNEWAISILFGSTILIIGEMRKSIKALRNLPF